MATSHPGSYGERRRAFVRVESQEENRLPPQQEQVVPDAEGCFVQCGRQKCQVTPMVGIILLYMLVSMSLTLLDKWLITGLGFNAPLALISLTYLIMHLASLSIRRVLIDNDNDIGLVDEEGAGNRGALVQQLSWHQWAWKVFPVAAASGLEVGTSTLGLQVMDVGLHTMVRSTVPIFVLLFSIGLGLQDLRCGLLAVVLLVSFGVSLMFSGQGSDQQADLPIEGFLLTLLSGMLAGLKWTLSQVLLQGSGLYGKEALTVGEQIHPFTLLHYMSISSAATLVPFVLALELGALRDMWVTFDGERIVETALLIVLVSLLALVLVLTEFTFIKKVSSLSLCIVGVVKELLLVLWSVGVRGEHLSQRTGLGFFVAMIGVTLYKVVPKGPPPPPPVRYELAPKNGGPSLSSFRGSPSTRPPFGGDAECGKNGHRISSRDEGEGSAGGQADRGQVFGGQRSPPAVTAAPSGPRTGLGSFTERHDSAAGASAGGGGGGGAVWDVSVSEASSAVLGRMVEVESSGTDLLESGTVLDSGGVATALYAGGVDVDVGVDRSDIPQ